MHNLLIILISALKKLLIIRLFLKKSNFYFYVGFSYIFLYVAFNRVDNICEFKNRNFGNIIL
jgi:hypothetical protein